MKSLEQRRAQPDKRKKAALAAADAAEAGAAAADAADAVAAAEQADREADEELEDELIEMELLRRRAINYHTGENDPIIKMGKRGVNLVIVGG